MLTINKTLYSSASIKLLKFPMESTPYSPSPPPFLLLRGTNSSLSTSLFTLLILLASVLASAKPARLNFGQHRGPTYSYNDGSKKRQNWWARFTISVANNKHNTKGHRVIKTKYLNNNWLATYTWHFEAYTFRAILCALLSLNYNYIPNLA